MNILIAGSTGFIGRNLVAELINNGHSLFCITRSKSKKKYLNQRNKNIKLINVDEIPLEKIFKNNNLDLLINLATDYGKEGTLFSKIIRSNILFAIELYELACAHNLKAIINMDTMLKSNLNPYALSKYQLLQWMKRINTGTKIIITN